MDRDALRELLAKVEAGSNLLVIDGFAAQAFPPENAYGKCTFHLVGKAFSGSLDAAKALHDAVLPGWEWRGRDDGRWWVWRTASDLQVGEADGNPARAWLIAILKALIAEEQT